MMIIILKFHVEFQFPLMINRFFVCLFVCFYSSATDTMLYLHEMILL